MKILRTCLVALIVTPVLAGPGPAADSVAASADPDGAKLAELIPVWEEALADLRVPGLAIAVVRGNEVLLARAFGQRDVESDRPANADTMYYIASSTKSFVALAVQILAEEGRVDLDAPVARYLPRFRLASEEATAAITVRDLLSHRQGLRHNAITQAEAYTGLFDEDLYYRLLAEVEPGGAFDYTNLHFTLLGRLIQPHVWRPEYGASGRGGRRRVAAHEGTKDRQDHARGRGHGLDGQRSREMAATHPGRRLARWAQVCLEGRPARDAHPPDRGGQAVLHLRSRALRTRLVRG